MARRRKARREGDEREWQDVLESQAEARGIDLDAEPPRKHLDHEETQHEELHRSLEKATRWEWMNDRKYASMFKQIEHKLEGVLGVGRFEWVDRRVFDQVFDQSTLLAVYKLMQKGHIDTIDFPIARGKEAHVFHATTPNGVAAVKIFHTSNAVFKGLMQYIEGDPRFQGLSRRHRELVNIWVRKEHRNLLRLAKQGLRVPAPHAVFKNVLVMDYIGQADGPSPRIRDIEIEDPEALFHELIEFIRIAWQDAELVHADLSEYNILWHDDEAMVIDVGQAVATAHPHAHEFLIRDVTRVVDWANRLGCEFEVADALAYVLEG